MADPSRLRRQLGAELRAARTLGDLTQRDLAGELGVSQATVVRLEKGEGQLLSRARTEELLAACSANDETRDRVLALTEAAHSETWRWDDGLKSGTRHLQGIARDRESGARRIRSYTANVVPGLLQTAEYARQLMPLADPTGAMDRAAAVAARMRRQEVLYESGRTFEFLLDEMCLRWSPGPRVMPGQLDRLVSISTLDAVRLGVLPSDREGAWGWHGFTLWDPLDDSPTYVTTELLHGGQVITDPDSVARYEALWKVLRSAAVTGDDAMKLIHRR